MIHRRIVLGIILLISAASGNATVLNVSLNNLSIGIDDVTGNIVSLSTRDAGLILSTRSGEAGVLDVAYPVSSFAAMRLASRFSRARVTASKNLVTITWDRLGASRPNLALPSGIVRAQVTIAAASDGRSIIWKSRIDNKSAAPIPQVLFPDLWGFKPFAGADNTRLRLGGGIVYPFVDSVSGSPGDPYFTALAWKSYPAGGYYNLNSLRWMDLGGFGAGLSVFQRKWGTEDWPNLITHRTERDPMNLRMAWEHKREIKPGESWESGEFWFTPHAGGWANGIDVYRAYVQQVNPPKPLPAHVRNDIGFQTIWMIQTAEVDPAKAAFRFEDLPRVAQDARRYGIHEIVPWGWCTYSTLPIQIRAELGSVDDLLSAVQRSRAAGVNIAPFISISVLRNQYAGRYGVAPSNDDWSYHYELIPMFRPYYTKFWNGVEIPGDNKLWESDVSHALDEWIDRGVASFSWDVFGAHSESGQRPGVLSVVEKLRNQARARDPQSTFSGESTSHLEFDSQALDYLWNWVGYVDAAPITNVFGSPRLNCNVERDALVVAKCFADNLYINAMPRKPDQPNGTALISEVPELAAALTRADRLRKQFLPYFIKGTFIGDSVLSQRAGAFVRGYQLDRKLLVIVLNDTKQEQSSTIASDLDLWLPRSSEYDIIAYDNNGAVLDTAVLESPRWFGTTQPLQPGTMAFFEIQPKGSGSRAM